MIGACKMMINFKEPFYSYDKLISDAKLLSIQYANLIQYVTIGTSHDNRDIVLLKLGFGKKYITFCSGVHGRESINPIVMMRILEYYADIYTHQKEKKELFKKQLINTIVDLESEYEQVIYGSCIYELLNTFTILMIPLLNPDGYMIALKGYDVIQDKTLKKKCLGMKIPNWEWKFNARGIDINRNFPSRLWKANHSEDYAASENETKALIAVFHKYNSKGFIDFHSRGKAIYYYRSMMSNNYNERQLEIAKYIQAITNYELFTPEEEVDNNDTGGNTVHYYSEYFNQPALTIETVEDDATFPLRNHLRLSTFMELKDVIFEFGSLVI